MLVLVARSSRYETLRIYAGGALKYDIIEFGRCVVPLGQTRALASGVPPARTPVLSRDGRRGLLGELLNYHFIGRFDLIRLATDTQSTREFVEADS